MCVCVCVCVCVIVWFGLNWFGLVFVFRGGGCLSCFYFSFFFFEFVCSFYFVLLSFRRFLVCLLVVVLLFFVVVVVVLFCSFVALLGLVWFGLVWFDLVWFTISSVASCLKHVRSSGQGTTVCSTPGVNRVEHVVCHMVRRDRLLSLTDLKLHLF